MLLTALFQHSITPCFHLITLSARNSTDCGIVRPICLAAYDLAKGNDKGAERNIRSHYQLRSTVKRAYLMITYCVKPKIGAVVPK